jgi:hypothetical protein
MYIYIYMYTHTHTHTHTHISICIYWSKSEIGVFVLILGVCMRGSMRRVLSSSSVSVLSSSGVCMPSFLSSYSVCMRSVLNSSSVCTPKFCVNLAWKSSRYEGVGEKI